MKDGTNRCRTRLFVGKDKEAALSRNNAETVTFAEASQSEHVNIEVADETICDHLSKMWFWASAA